MNLTPFNAAYWPGVALLLKEKWERNRCATAPEASAMSNARRSTGKRASKSFSLKSIDSTTARFVLAVEGVAGYYNCW